MRSEVRELTSDTSNRWLRELFLDVSSGLSTDFERGVLVIAKSFSQAMGVVKELRERKSREIGITGAARSLGPISNEAYENPAWKIAAVPPEYREFYVIIKPGRIRERGMTYEHVTEGMAHEISEAVVLKKEQSSWSDYSADQVRVLNSFSPLAVEVLNLCSIMIRERLADRYSAEHGYGREMLACLSSTYLDAFGKSLGLEKVKVPSNLSNSMKAIGWDKSISLESVGMRTVARTWMEIWEADLQRRGKTYSQFLRYYREFRNGLLKMPLTANSLLTIFNTRAIESF